MLLAAAGHEVVLVDRSEFPSDTLSTHAIARSGVVQLTDGDCAGGARRRDTAHSGGRVPRRRFVGRSDGQGPLGCRHARRAPPSCSRCVARRCCCGGRRPIADRGDGRRRPRATTAGSPASAVERDGRARALGAIRRRRRRAAARASLVRSTRVHGGPHAGSGATHYAYFAGEWPAMEYTSVIACSPASSRRTTAKPASGCARPRTRRGAFRRAPNDRRCLRRDGAGAAPALAERSTPPPADRRPVESSGSPTTSAIRSGLAGHWSATPAITATRSRATASATRSATQNCWRLPSISSSRDEADESSALTRYHADRDEQLREIFEITCELVTFPPVGTVRRTAAATRQRDR